MNSSPVAIVGAGPNGLMMALLLARAGVPNMVFEKHPGISRHPKAMGVTRRTAEIYRQLGLLARMREQDFTGKDVSLMIWAKSLTGEILGRAPISNLHSPYSPCSPFHCPQTWTETVLLDAVEKESLATVRFGHEVTALREDDGGVTLEIQSAAGAENWKAGWLVAADGAASATRRLIGMEAQGPGDMGHFLNVFFRAPLGEILRERRSVLYNVLRPDLIEFFVAVNGDDLWLMHHFLQDGETPADYPHETLKNFIRDAAGLPGLAVEILGVAPWVMSPKVTAQYRHGRILFTGDAAARLSPSGGLGLNNGMQSSHNLAWKLADVVHDRANPGLLDTYHQERHDLAVGIMQRTNSNAEEVMAYVQLALKGDFDGLRRLIASSHRQKPAHGLDIGIAYENGALIPDGSAPAALADPLNDYAPSGRPGSRFPHAEVTRNGQMCSTLDFFGKDFVVVAGQEAALEEDGRPAIIRLGSPSAILSDESFLEILGLSPTGALLVRPDGYIAWRKPADAASDDIRAALEKILRPENGL